MGDSQATGWTAPGPPSQKRAIKEAAEATKTTRKYCISATVCASAPWASAMIIIALAAPGEVPHTAVEPDSAPQRLISQPIRLLAATTARMTLTKSGASFKKATTIAGVIARAMRQPRIAWAA